jgi:hypothetical protein
MNPSNLAIWAPALLLAAACSSASSPAHDAARGAEDAAVEDGVAPADTLPAGDGTPSTDSPRQDDVAAPDLPGIDVPPGTGELGTECDSDSDCASGLCWASTLASGCTQKCNRHADCQDLGLVCSVMREGLAGCVPPPQVGAQCSSHQDCVYPTACIDEFGWCDLPECTFAGDCPDGQICEVSVRKCQNIACSSNYECADPADFCIDGTCGPPQCTQSAECGDGNICSKAQGICTDATPCKDGACSFYNQVCVNGLCEPNLCATPCQNASEQCNPDTGKCGLPCQTDDACPKGQVCETGKGLCYPNQPPLAVARILKDGELLPAANLPAMSVITLDASLSSDPESTPLAYRWMLLSMPPGSAGMLGTVFCQTVTCQTGPLLPGLHLFGLWVEDAAGAVSIQAATAAYMQ